MAKRDKNFWKTEFWPFSNDVLSKKDAKNFVKERQITETKLEEAKEQIAQTTNSKTIAEKNTDPNVELLNEAIKLHDLGVAGDKEAVTKAHDLLEKLLKEDPKNQLVEGYYGSVKSLVGRDAIDPTKRFNKTLEGLKILDQVVKDNPDNIQVRILRANVCYRLPEMYFQRTKTAIEDFNYLISRYQEDNTVFSENYYWQLLYDLGGAYKNVQKHQEAKETWLKLAEITTDPKYQKLLKQAGIKLPKKSKSVKEHKSSKNYEKTKEQLDISKEINLEKTDKKVTIPEEIFVKDTPDNDLENEDANLTDYSLSVPVEEEIAEPEIASLDQKVTLPEVVLIEDIEDAKDIENVEDIEDDEDVEDVEDTSNIEIAALLKEGIELHTAALNGDKMATLNAFDFFSEAHNKNPDNDLITAYYADCLSLKGRDSKVPTSMFGNAIKATKLLDTVVNANPDNIQIRYIRAYQSFRLPEGFFRRTASAIADFEYLIERYEEDENALSRDTYWQVLNDLGVAYKRLGMDEQASATWDKLLSQTPYDEYHDLIEQQEGTSLTSIDSLLAHASKEELLKEGIRLHDLGVAGNGEAAKRAHEILGKVHEMDPNDAIALGYYGSSVALLGRDAIDPSVMFGNAIKGLKIVKKAINKDSTNPKLRLLRGYIFKSLPEAFFPLGDKAIKDLRYVKTAYEQDNTILPQELYWQVLYDLGALYQNMGNYKKANKHWETLLAVSTDPKYKKLVDIDMEE